MQKLDLRNNLAVIIKLLKTEEIINTFAVQRNLSKNDVVELLMESKKGYDSSSYITDINNILSKLFVDNIYETNFFTKLIVYASSVDTALPDRKDLLINDSIQQFYAFHRTLMGTFKLIDQLLITDRTLFDGDNQFSLDGALENGNLMLQIIDNEDVRITKIIKVLEGCQHLIDNISEYLNERNKQKDNIIPTISLIDNGSDININVKLPKEVAVIMAKLLREFWEYVSNNKTYKLKKKNEAIEDSLTLIKEIHNYQNDQIIDNETAERLKKGILSNTESIVFNSTLPKKIVIENQSFMSNRDILISKTQTLLLENNIYQKGLGGNEDIITDSVESPEHNN